MKNLHKISRLDFPIPVTDMLISNLWYIITDNYAHPAGYEGVRINLRKSFTNAELVTSDYDNKYSPIERMDYGHWSQWYWEYERVAQWLDAGKPFVDLNKIKILTI